MGGRVSLLANSLLPLRVAVCYYGGGIDQLADRAASLHGKQPFFWGGLDKHINSEQIHVVLQQMEVAGRDCINVKISDADHGFNCDGRASYHPRAAREAWAMTLAFLEE